MDFLDQHNFITLIGLAIFPRVTMLIVSFKVNHNIDYYLGYIFAPHLLAAIYSLNYWDTNPVLVIIAWMFAIGATPAEIGYLIALGIGLFSSIRKQFIETDSLSSKKRLEAREETSGERFLRERALEARARERGEDCPVFPVPEITERQPERRKEISSESLQFTLFAIGAPGFALFVLLGWLFSLAS